MDAMTRFERDCTAFFQALYPGGQSPLVFGAGLAKQPVLMLIGRSPRRAGGPAGTALRGQGGEDLEGFLEVAGPAPQ